MSQVIITTPVSIQCKHCRRRRAFDVPVEQLLSPSSRIEVFEKARAEGWQIDGNGARCHRLACNVEEVASAG